jgi:hypothetical protein
VGYLPLSIMPISSDAGKPQASNVGAPEAEQQAGKALDATHNAIYVSQVDEQKALELAAMRHDFGAALAQFKDALVAGDGNERDDMRYVTAPAITVTMPELPTPQVTVIMPESKAITPNVFVNVPAPVVNFTAPEQKDIITQPQIVINVPEPPAPIVNIEAIPVDVNLSVAPTTSVVKRNSFGQIEEIESVPHAEIVA